MYECRENVITSKTCQSREKLKSSQRFFLRKISLKFKQRTNLLQLRLRNTLGMKNRQAGQRDKVHWNLSPWFEGEFFWVPFDSSQSANWRSLYDIIDGLVSIATKWLLDWFRSAYSVESSFFELVDICFCDSMLCNYFQIHKGGFFFIFGSLGGWCLACDSCCGHFDFAWNSGKIDFFYRGFFFNQSWLIFFLLVFANGLHSTVRWFFWRNESVEYWR